MTIAQALNNLSLSADADIETIRLRFASRYIQSDLQYDRTLTDEMKAIHEQHLRELEQSYKLLTNNQVISDMGALLSLGKGYVEENNESIGQSETVNTEEALAFFALYPYDTALLAEERYQLYCKELHVAMDAVNLEATKEPYRRELSHAEDCLTIAVNYLLAGHMFTQISANEDDILEEEGFLLEPGTSETSNDAAHVLVGTVELKSNSKRKQFLMGIVLIIICVALYLIISRS